MNPLLLDRAGLRAADRMLGSLARIPGITRRSAVRGSSLGIVAVSAAMLGWGLQALSASIAGGGGVDVDAVGLAGAGAVGLAIGIRFLRLLRHADHPEDWRLAVERETGGAPTRALFLAALAVALPCTAYMAHAAWTTPALLAGLVPLAALTVQAALIAFQMWAGAVMAGADATSGPASAPRAATAA